MERQQNKSAKEIGRSLLEVVRVGSASCGECRFECYMRSQAEADRELAEHRRGVHGGPPANPGVNGAAGRLPGRSEALEVARPSVPQPQSEDVWALVDGVGQPCLFFVMHRGPGRREPEVPENGLEEEYGPYRWVPYRLEPAVQRGREAGA